MAKAVGNVHHESNAGERLRMGQAGILKTQIGAGREQRKKHQVQCDDADDTHQHRGEGDQTGEMGQEQEGDGDRVSDGGDQELLQSNRLLFTKGSS